MGTQRGAALLVLMLLALFAAWLAVSLPQSAPRTLPAGAASAADAAYRAPASMTVYYRKEGGVYSYGGQVDLPACDTFSTSISTAGSPAPSVRIALTVFPDPGCAGGAQATSTPFSVSVGSPGADPTLSGITINGAPVPFTLVQNP